MAGYLTTHVLDTATGKPAKGLRIDLLRIDGDTHTLLATVETNDDGRTDKPILGPEDFVRGIYSLVFYAGDYLQANGASSEFLDVIPLRFGMSDDDHYHVPLLLSPFGYSTYRGS